MRQLLLLRHAKAATGDNDHARPLTADGRAAAASLRTCIRELGLLPDVILVSSARRTLQTLEALAPWDETPIIEPLNGLYMATPDQILAIIGGVAETVRGLMVISHNPGLHELALRLAGVHVPSANVNIGAPARLLAEDFPTGALAEFTVTKSWRELSGAGAEAGGRLVRFICARDVPEVET